MALNSAGSAAGASARSTTGSIPRRVRCPRRRGVTDVGAEREADHVAFRDKLMAVNRQAGLQALRRSTRGGRAVPMNTAMNRPNTEVPRSRSPMSTSCPWADERVEAPIIRTAAAGVVEDYAEDSRNVDGRGGGPHEAPCRGTVTAGG